MPGSNGWIAASLLMSLLLGAPTWAAAQTAPPPKAADTVSAGTDLMVTGSLGSSNAGFLSAAVQASAYRGEAGWAVRGTLSEEFEIFGPTPALSVWDVGVLRVSRSAPEMVVRHFGFGAALTGGMNRGARTGHSGGWFGSATYEEKPFLTPGLIAMAGITIAPLPYLAVGATGSGNLNARRPYLAAVLTVSLGHVR